MEEGDEKLALVPSTSGNFGEVAQHFCPTLKILVGTHVLKGIMTKFIQYLKCGTQNNL